MRQPSFEEFSKSFHILKQRDEPFVLASVIRVHGSAWQRLGRKRESTGQSLKKKLRFWVRACAICSESTSIMSQHLKGKTLENSFKL